MVGCRHEVDPPSESISSRLCPCPQHVGVFGSGRLRVALDSFHAELDREGPSHNLSARIHKLAHLHLRDGIDNSELNERELAEWTDMQREARELERNAEPH